MTLVARPRRQATTPHAPHDAVHTGRRVWEWPAFAGLLLATAVLYLWNLSASGWANSFYAAAVQAGSSSWKAFFFGSFDSSNFITVDKPPASLWVMDISARLFGVSSWSILVPQALEGVAAVAVLYLVVRRWFGPAAGLLAGGVLAVTPVAALMFRFNNPDALLVLLLTGAAYATLRATEHETSRRWLLAAAALVGTAFLTKMLQAFIVVPVFAGVYLLAAPGSRAVRARALGWAAAVLLAASGWWVAIVELWPASSRPYIGGSQDNSLLNLIFGYNGFGRLTGNESGSVGGAAGAGGRWGATGWDRLFGTDMGGQISWLIPAALILLAAGLWYTRRRPRTDRTRAALVLWGGWLVLTGAVFSYAAGIIHPYYTVALAPVIGALIGIGATMLWQRRSETGATALMAAVTAVSSLWAYELLERTPSWQPELRWIVLLGGLGVSAALLGLAWIDRHRASWIAALAVAVCLIGPVAYSLETATTAHAGALPTAGPASQSGFGGPGGMPGRGSLRSQLPGGGAPPQGGMPSQGGAPPQQGTVPSQASGRAAGGLLNGSTPSAALTRALSANAASYRWVAATVGAESASGYQLASGHPVMAIGGFNGTDPTPTLSQFEAYVAAGKIHYFIASGGAGGGFGGGGTGSDASAITRWVKQHYTSTTVGGVAVYDLSR